jgi:cell division protein FtsW
VIALCVFGLIMVYSASWDFSQAVYQDSAHIFFRQVMWMAIGVALIFGLNYIDYHKYRGWVVAMLAGTIALLIGVLVVNQVRFGAARSFLEGSVQPSELAKLVIVLYLSVWLYAKRDTLHDVGLGLAPLAVILGVVGGLIYRQPDLSAAATVLILGGLLFFLAGGDLRQIVLLMVIALLVGWVIVQINATGRERLSSYMAGLQDPLQSSYHVRRSLEAVVRGSCAPHRQHLRRARRGARFHWVRAPDGALRSPVLARIAYCQPGSRHAGHPHRRRTDLLDCHRGDHQHGSHGWLGPLRRQYLAAD